MTNPWKGISPGKSKLISEKILNHDFYWYVEDRNNNPCLLFKIKNQNRKINLKKDEFKKFIKYLMNNN